MGFFKDIGKGLSNAVSGVGQAIDPTSDMSWSERGEKLARGTLAVGSGGLTEVARAGTKALTGITDVKPSDYTASVNAQQQLQANKPMLQDLMAASQARQAPTVATPIGMSRAGIRDVTSANLGQAPTVTQTQIDPEAVGLARSAALGLEPSAAQGMLQQGVSQAGQLGMALAGARGGYSPAAVRGAQREMSASIQNAAAQASTLRAQEMASAREQFGNLAVQAAGLSQQAKLFNATQEGQFIMQQAENDMKAAMANQGVDLDVLKTNAARGDQFALANLQSQLQTMGMNDAMQLAYVSQILGIDEQVLATEMARVGIDAQRHMADQAARTQLFQSVIKATGEALAKVGSSAAGAAGAGG